LDWIWTLGSRSDGCERVGRPGGGARRRRRGVRGGASPDLAVNGRPGSVRLGAWSGSKLTMRQSDLGQRRGLARAEQSARWRMAERRRRRTGPSEAEREEGGNGVGELLYLHVKLWEASKSSSKQRNGSAAADTELQQWHGGARVLARSKGGNCGFGAPRGAGRHLYRGARASWRAGQGKAGRARGRVGLGRESGSRTSSGTSPTGGAKWRRDREGRGVASGWAGIEVNGPAALVSWAAGEERKKRKEGEGELGRTGLV